LQSIRQWLSELGLEQYAAAFERDDVDVAVLPDLTEADLQQLGSRSVTASAFSPPCARRTQRRSASSAVDEAPAPARSPTSSVNRSPPKERRQVCVLFCDLVGSTALSNRLDPEEYRKVLARYHEACIGCVQRFDGFVAQIQGDGVVAYFGYPLAHEGEAERAMRAALAIVQALGALDVGLGRPLAVRIGVASGLVVVSHVLAPDKSAVGERPIGAAAANAGPAWRGDGQRAHPGARRRGVRLRRSRAAHAQGHRPHPGVAGAGPKRCGQPLRGGHARQGHSDGRARAGDCTAPRSLGSVARARGK
jgi:class 3 adenylate cyclase